MDTITQWFMPMDALAAITPTITHDEKGIHGAGEAFSWETHFTPYAAGVWVETTLHTKHSLTFNPAMIVWLGRLDNLDDRQAHTWRQTILRAPTTNQQGLSGNDLPAGFLYDHEQRKATVIYFPPESFAWAKHRFYELTVRDVTEYRPIPRYGIGLIPNTPNPEMIFPPGTHQFRFWYRQHAFDAPISAWEAQNFLIQSITPLLDVQPTLIPDAPGWEAMAGGALNDLYHDACWIDVQGKQGLRAYVKGSSAVGRDQAKGFELMTQLDVLLPLLHWRNHTGETGANALIERLLEAVRAYQIIEPHSYLPNHYPYQSTDTFMDTWYFYENALIKLPWVAHLTGDSTLKQTFLTALEGGRELAHHTNYLLPLFADANGWHPRNGLLNVSVSGMYAAGCILAYQMTDDVRHLDEAKAALKTLHQLPPHMLIHEPQQLSFAAAAANFLSQHEAGGNWQHKARDFVNLSLRMGYWGKDSGVPFYDPRGMFQACASLSYPAYKENVEVIWAWSELLNTPGAEDVMPIGLMAAFANLQRCHNYAFFDAFLPESVRRGPCPYIPYEDIATTEFNHTATFGKELYGAGEVFWSALLFARPEMLNMLPPDILIFSMNVPCLKLQRSSPSRRWLVYNPHAESVEITHQENFLLLPNSFKILEG